MPNNNIFFISSKWEEEADYLYIYRLKSSGEVYYNENNNDFKSIFLSSFSLSEPIYSTTINGVGLIIDNTEYIFICQFRFIECQLVEFENDIIFNQYLKVILNIDENNYIQSTLFTILNLNKDNKILLGFTHYKHSEVYEPNYLDLLIINLKKDEDIRSYEIEPPSIIAWKTNSVHSLALRCLLTSIRKDVSDSFVIAYSELPKLLIGIIESI